MRAFSVSCLAVCLAGCPKPSDGPTLPPNQRYCVDVYRARADFYERCGVATTAELERDRAEVALKCENVGWSESLALGRAALDADAGAACLSQLRAQPCASTVPTSEGIPARCFLTDHGIVTQGEACFVDDDCTPDLFCATERSCPGHCEPRLALGAAVAPWQRCVPGAEAYDGTCTALVEVGGSCAPSGNSTERHACVAGSFCNGTSCVEVSGLKKEGETCDRLDSNPCVYGLGCALDHCAPLAKPGESCGSNQCQLGAFCDQREGRCALVHAAGETCDSQTPCAARLSCVGGTCVKGWLLGVGEACGGAVVCAFGLYCAADGGCDTRKQLGEPCGSNSACVANSYCAAGVCNRRKSNGETCTASAFANAFECSSNRCEDGGCTGLIMCSGRN
ncbi:MAG: hypothetical protein QM817_14070 [Archangium sp.]